MNKEQILDWYMDDVLSGILYHHVYQFTREHEITEQQFYDFFGNLDQIESYFFELLIDKTIETLYNTEEYAIYSPEEKLLSFYYTFFGNMTANRSFVLHVLKEKNLETLKKLSGLRTTFKTYIESLDIEKLDLKQKDLNKFQDKAFAESAWLQLLGVIQYWKNDTSARFEKTDIFIEKSLNASFELINVEALKKVTDFGKFLLKEMKSK
ncbi:TetR/AcrR family transcriptional regulator [Flavobacteriaceae bacterium Ap0902]|nr:TetR/AcrR family transcriptional regulator [Flavobacteriaceae bacterium Ap0902]